MGPKMGEELVPRWEKVWSVRWVSLIGVTSLYGAIACATATGEPEPSAAASVGKAEQVVQRVMPAPAEARTSAQANTSDGAAASPSREARSAGGGISSRHLEAELNRLEAELRR
jgi:hypothetical protein